MAPLRKMFSRPVRSGWNPVPTSNKLAIRPFTFMLPVVGAVTLANYFSNVDFPAPFLPIIPSISPCFTSKFISFNAQMKSSACPASGVRRLADKIFSCPIINVGSGRPRILYNQRWRSPFRVFVPIRPNLYCLETFSILITGDITWSWGWASFAEASEAERLRSKKKIKDKSHKTKGRLKIMV